MTKNTSKNEQIARTMSLTRLKRHSLVCKSFKFKIDKRKLSKEQKESIKMMFVESKWIYNYILALGDSIFEVDYKNLSNITHKDRYGNDVPVAISYVRSSVKQELIKLVITSIRSLSSKKKRGMDVGKLKFKSDFKCVKFKLYGTTHNIKGSNRFKLLGIPKTLKVYGLEQLSKYKNTNIDYASCCLTTNGYDYFIVLTCYIDKQPTQHTIQNTIIGVDMGLKDNLTLSNGDKINIQVEETERLKRLLAKLQRLVKCSNNYYKTKSLIAKEYQYMSNKKNDITNKIVHRLLTNYSNIVIQDDNLNEWKDGASSNHTNRGKEIQHSVLGRIKMRLKESSLVIWLDRWFPTTLYCFECNTSTKHDTTKRTFVCSNCGNTQDRDVHASLNMVLFYKLYTRMVGTTNVTLVRNIQYKDYVKLLDAKQETTTSV